MDFLVELMSKEKGVPALCVLVTIFILIKVAEIIWTRIEKQAQVKEDTVQKLIETVQNSTVEIKEIKLLLQDLPKLKLDLNRYFRVVKIISGDRWREAYRQALDEEREI